MYTKKSSTTLTVDDLKNVAYCVYVLFATHTCTVHMLYVRKVLCSAANVLSRDSAPTTPAGGTIPPSKACKSWCTKGKFKPEQYCKFVACEACPKLKYYTFCIYNIYMYMYLCTHDVCSVSGFKS